MLLSARTRNYIAASDGIQTSDTPSVFATRADQQISKGTTKDNTFKQLVLLYLKNSIHHEISIYSTFEFAHYSFMVPVMCSQP